jgi:hypothetical protein
LPSLSNVFRGVLLKTGLPPAFIRNRDGAP